MPGEQGHRIRYVWTVSLARDRVYRGYSNTDTSICTTPTFSVRVVSPRFFVPSFSLLRMVCVGPCRVGGREKLWAEQDLIVKE